MNIGKALRRMADAGHADEVLLQSEAEKWDGWGTALKPAWEPVIVCFKPIKS